MAHGSRVFEEPTSPGTPTVVPGIVPVVFGTAPVNLVQGIDNVNKPIKCESFTDFKKQFGFSKDWDNYTLCEVADAAFIEFEVAPFIFVNVLDPEVHKKRLTEQTLTIENHKATIKNYGVLKKSLKLIANNETLKEDVDYIASFNDDGLVTIAFLTIQEAVIAEYDMLDPSLVTATDVIGGYDVDTGKASGLECINKVFPRLRMVPSLILAPKFALDPTVAAVMRAKATSVNKYFKSFALTDADTSETVVFTDVFGWKNDNGYTGKLEAFCWPLVAKKNKVYHLSTHLACNILKVCTINKNYPYESASNKTIPIDKIVVKKGDSYEEVELEPNQAEILNDQGIVTALNFVNGFVTWGNYTAAYPDVTDIKDKFHATRLMHNFIGNTIVLKTWEKVDGPIRRRLVDEIVDEMNMWMNGLQGEGAIIGGRVEARAEDNPKEQLTEGKIIFRYFVAEPTPAQEIENILQVDTSYYDKIFN
ncbi:phage tail sheath family protein [Lysinibacillus sp. NPDC093692]|uniref:phage tail sheath family protein n=1 Tax=Lysinibacillus sp. NPDC093692 TaxID=3390578 RepID=UPI003CFDEB69